MNVQAAGDLFLELDGVDGQGQVATYSLVDCLICVIFARRLPCMYHIRSVAVHYVKQLSGSGSVKQLANLFLELDGVDGHGEVARGRGIPIREELHLRALPCLLRKFE